MLGRRAVSGGGDVNVSVPDLSPSSLSSSSSSMPLPSSSSSSSLPADAVAMHVRSSHLHAAARHHSRRRNSNGDEEVTVNGDANGNDEDDDEDDNPDHAQSRPLLASPHTHRSSSNGLSSLSPSSSSSSTAVPSSTVLNIPGSTTASTTTTLNGVNGHVNPSSANGATTSSSSTSSTTSSAASPDTSSSLKFLCFDLTWMPPRTRFLILSVGVFAFFLLNGYVEEYTFKGLPRFEYGWYLTFFELVCFSVFAVLERMLLTHEPVFSNAVPLSRHLVVALAMTASRGLTNVSLQYLIVPTQIIFKSMKLIPVMAGSLVMLRASYSLQEYASALLLVLSACLFSLGDNEVKASGGGASAGAAASVVAATTGDAAAVDAAAAAAAASAAADAVASLSTQTIGIVVVLFSLVADSVHSNTQDLLLRKHKSSSTEAMLFTNSFAAIAALIVVLFKGELTPALEYCAANPIAYPLFIFRSVIIYGGVLCFVLMIKSSGVVVATGVTTVRKILSILISFIMFPKPFTAKYMWGILTFLASVVISQMRRR